MSVVVLKDDFMSARRGVIFTDFMSVLKNDKTSTRRSVIFSVQNLTDGEKHVKKPKIGKNDTHSVRMA
jgi:hypothetical protein